ncbi:MAG: 50S ribosomal protein L16, partial [Chloroflexota bacterium]
MLQPKRVKYRNAHRGHRRGKAHAGASVAFGEYGLKAMASTWITARQLEAARRAMTHHIKRGGQVWTRVFPDLPRTMKPAETRQG